MIAEAEDCEEGDTHCMQGNAPIVRQTRPDASQNVDPPFAHSVPRQTFALACDDDLLEGGFAHACTHCGSVRLHTVACPQMPPTQQYPVEIADDAETAEDVDTALTDELDPPEETLAADDAADWDDPADTDDAELTPDRAEEPDEGVQVLA